MAGIRLTPTQRSLLYRERIPADDGKGFILLSSHGDDRVARALAAKGLGWFQNNGVHYSWRRRDGFTNNFWPDEERVREVLGER
jgi:hypothetical protein